MTTAKKAHKAAQLGIIVCHVLFFAGHHLAILIVVLWTLEEAINLIWDV